MSAANKGIAAAALILGLLCSVVWGAANRRIPIDRVAALAMTQNGRAALAAYDGGRIRIREVDARGVVRAETSTARERDGYSVSVADMGCGDDGILYVLLDLCDPVTGEIAAQELELYDLSGILRKRVARCALAGEGAPRYRWLSATSAVVLMGTGEDGASLAREAYDPASLYGRAAPEPRSRRTYPLARGEGIWKAVPAGTDVAYATLSGKVFLTREEESEAQEVYPARHLTQVMVPLFLSPQGSESVFIGEYESGDILSLSLADGSTRRVKSGTEPFSGVSGHTPADIRAAVMRDELNFAALAPRSGGDGFDLLSGAGGSVSVAGELRPSLPGLLGRGAFVWLVAAAAAMVLLLMGRLLLRVARAGRTIRAKLMVYAVPLFAAALAAFGFFSYGVYSDAIEKSFRKQAEDEGSLLTALFGTESFEEIEYPYDYTGEAYTYLHDQLATRTVHTATACYERGALYTGVDFDHPCFYPFDVRLDSGASALYHEAAFSGRPAAGMLDDGAGRRLACVTPVGGSSGNTVYLLETGIPLSSLRAYTGAYLRGYLLLSAAFVAAVGLVLMMVFTRVLRPIGEIRKVLEEFSRGNRAVRLENAASDEFSAITRVFNKMAGDIDAQMYNLQQLSDTYFRFIPRRMLRLLDRQNLGEIGLGAGRSLTCPVLLASVEFDAAGMEPEREQELTNRFFGVVNRAADSAEATLVTDSVNLRRLRVVCTGDGADAVEVALASLAGVDSANAGLPVQHRLRALFIVHRAPVYYGICGDNGRLVPALLSGELDVLAAQRETLARFGCRLLVTRAAAVALLQDRYARRFIGCLPGRAEEKFGLYDFYDATPPVQTRLINETRPTFDKAMELFAAGRRHEAKNLFALVLRQNQYDDVARHYVFLCETDHE